LNHAEVQRLYLRNGQLYTTTDAPVVPPYTSKKTSSQAAWLDRMWTWLSMLR
jgi:hypothetical protein